MVLSLRVHIAGLEWRVELAELAVQIIPVDLTFKNQVSKLNCADWCAATASGESNY